MGRLWWIKDKYIFESLSLTHLKQIEYFMKECKYDNDRIIFSSELPGDSIHIIKNGRVEIFKKSSIDINLILDILNPGDVFGNISLSNIGEKNTFVKTIDDNVEIKVLRKKQLEELIKHEPVIIDKIITNIKTLFEKQKNVIEKDLFKIVAGRVARLLCLSYEDYIMVPGKTQKLNFKININEISSLVGASKEIVNSVIDYFFKKEFISIETKFLTIIDINKLQNWYS